MLAIVAAIVIFARRRGRPPENLRTAYAATAAARDRLAREVSAPSAALDQLVDEADRALRAAQVSGLSGAARSAVERALSAVAEVREALARRAPGADVESALLRSLASLDAALGPLQAAAGGEEPPGSGDSMGFSS